MEDYTNELERLCGVVITLPPDVVIERLDRLMRTSPFYESAPMLLEIEG